MTRRAVVLLSGGLDSATVAAIARRDGYDIYAMSFRYGQRTRSSSTPPPRLLRPSVPSSTASWTSTCAPSAGRR